MKFLILLSLFSIVVLVECYNMFAGTSEYATIVYQHTMKYDFKFLRKETEHFNFTMPQESRDNKNDIIKGVLAIDMKESKSVASITSGGPGCNYVNIQMKSPRGKGMKYKITIYA